MASTTDTRAHQRFPVLTAAQIASARRFASGPAQRFAPGEAVYAIGERNVRAWLVLEGSIRVFRHEGISGRELIVVHGVGQLTGEVNQLSGRGSLSSAEAGPDGALAIPFDAAHLRALMIGSAEVGEIVMRALILRRVALIENGRSGTVVVGDPEDGEVIRLENFLSRSGYPHVVVDAADDAEGRALVERIDVQDDELPLVVCPSGAMLKRPSEAALASCLGIVPEIDPARLYDVAVVGAGPAGLAAAVYGASEGLSVIVLDTRPAGGQAGASSRIENYLGFPTGISGHALAGRALNQALKFGAEIVVPVEVERLDCRNGLTLELAGGGRVRARTVVIASGAEYRRPGIDGLAAYEGTCVSYWASPIEAKLCSGEEVVLVGGGNSAGQAIVFLASHVGKLHVLVRRPLSETMSRYLIERIEALPNVEVHVGREIAGLEGDDDGGLAAALFRRRSDGAIERYPAEHMFLFIGADPNTGWLRDCIDTDDKGFLPTGRGGLPLETSVAGVFAIGDVRAGSTKRVAAAVGEGAAVIAQVHQTLARLRAAEVERETT